MLMMQGTASLQISLLTGGSVICLYFSSISFMVSPASIFLYYIMNLLENPVKTRKKAALPVLPL